MNNNESKEVDFEQNDKKERQYKRMTETPVRRLILSLSVPTVIAMLITAAYSTADTYFVSQLGKSASGAVGIVMPVMAIIQAVGFTFGMGGGSLISRLLGEKKHEEASQVAQKALSGAFTLGIIITIAGLAFSEPILYLLGATPTILPYAVDYGIFIFIAAPILACSFVLNNTLRAEGKALFSMIGIGAGGIINIALDPLFIMGFDMGIAGAALATAISQLISFSILITPFITGKTIVRYNIKNSFNRPITYLHIIKTGLPSFCRQGLASVASILLNNSASPFGDAAISAMTIVSRVAMIMNSAFIGFGQGYQPVAGYNFGAKKFKRVRSAFFFTMFLGSGIMLTLSVGAWIFAEGLMGAFIDDAEVIEIGIGALRAQCLSFPFMSLGIVCNMTFQSTGQSFKATFLSAARQGVFFIPLIIILPQLIGINGVMYSQAIADILTFVCAIPFAAYFIVYINKKIGITEVNQNDFIDG